MQWLTASYYEIAIQHIVSTKMAPEYLAKTIRMHGN